jgi:N-acetylglucosaminyldiphosphoundecaprenol N-acetyl-beta-D-mannosaminyltransferase
MHKVDRGPVVYSSTAAGEPLGRVNIIGVGVHPLRFQAAIDLLERWIGEAVPRIIVFPGSDSLAACNDHPDYREILNTADLTATDGMMLVRLCRWFGASQAERVYGPDVMLALCERSAQSGHRHFFYGGAPGIAEKLASRLVQKFPGLQIAGTYSPPFRPLADNERAAISRHINDSNADILWVGLGAPKQEFWVWAPHSISTPERSRKRQPGSDRPAARQSSEY